MRHFYLIILFIIPSFSAFSQSSITKLFFSSWDDITMLDFDNIPPSVVYTGVTNGFEAIAHAEDQNGDVVFYVNANGVYRSNNVQMPGSAGLLANNSSAEINICQVPGSSTQYYILYNAETCSELYYSIVDMTLAGGQGDVVSLNTMISSDFYGEGLEVVRIPGTQNYWFVTYKCNDGIYVHEINAAGIQPEFLALTYANGTNDVRGEMDYHDGKMVNCDAFLGEMFYFDFDPVTGMGANAQTVAQTGVYGAEFSPDASKLYYSDWGGGWGGNNCLFQLDIATGNITGYTLPTSPGQIELGPDGKLYIILGAAEIGVIENPDDLAINITYTPTNFTLSLGVSDHIQSDVLFVPNMELTLSAVDALCNNSSDGSVAVSVTGGTQPYTFLWDDPAGQTDSIATNLPSGTYTVTVTDSSGISVSGDVTVNAPTALSAVNVLALDVSCHGGNDGTATVTLSGGTPPYTENWIGVNPGLLPAGTHSYVALDANNCQVSGDVTIEEPSALQILVLPQQADCFDFKGSATASALGGTAPYTFNWMGVIPTEIEPGNHEISVVDNNGCSHQDSYYVKTPDYPTANFNTTPDVGTITNPELLFEDASSSLTAAGAPVYWRWEFLDEGLTILNDRQFYHKLDSVGVYRVLLYVENALGCADSALGYVEMLDEHLIYVPSAFTPNGDGDNDYFTISANYVDPSTFVLNIYDRWGGLVYHSTDIELGWDGSHKASKVNVQTGVYVYDVRVNSVIGKELRRVGEVHLTR